MLTVQYVKRYNMSLACYTSYVVQKENQTKLYYYIKKLSLCNFVYCYTTQKNFQYINTWILCGVFSQKCEFISWSISIVVEYVDVTKVYKQLNQYM